MTMQEVNAALMGGGGKSARFEAIGATVVGIVQSVDVRQRTDFKTGDLMVWADGNPRNQLVITLATEQRDEDADDYGHRNLYVPNPSQLQKALAEAIRKVGAQGIVAGMKLGVKYVKDEPNANPRLNATKQYTVKVELPVQGVSLDEMGEPEDEDSLPF